MPNIRNYLQSPAKNIWLHNYINNETQQKQGAD